MQVLAFPRGNIYTILCQDGQQALRIQADDPKQFNNARIVGTGYNPSDLNQLFMIEKVGLNDDEYQIVHCTSGLVFDEEGQEIHLKRGKQNSDQLFFVERAPVQGNYYWIKTDKTGKKALALQGPLRFKMFDCNVPNQLFSIQLVNNCPGLNETCIILNNNSGKALDVPGGTLEHGQRIIQYTKNKRFNQRWRWIPSGNGFLIQSLLSNLCLDIESEKKTAGARVVQWDRTGGSNQLWRPELAGNGVYKIKSLHAPGMCLGIKNQDVDDGGKLEIFDNDNPSMYWRIEGYVPK